MDIFPQFPNHLLIISGRQLLFSVKSVNFLNPWNYDTPNWASNLRFLSWAKHYLKKCPMGDHHPSSTVENEAPTFEAADPNFRAVLKNKSDFVAGSIVLTLNTITICIYIYYIYIYIAELHYFIKLRCGNFWDIRREVVIQSIQRHPKVASHYIPFECIAALYDPLYHHWWPAKFLFLLFKGYSYMFPEWTAWGQSLIAMRHLFLVPPQLPSGKLARLWKPPCLTAKSSTNGDSHELC